MSRCDGKPRERRVRWMEDEDVGEAVQKLSAGTGGVAVRTS